MRTPDNAPTIEEVRHRTGRGQKRLFHALAWTWTALIFILCWIPPQGLPDDESTPRFIRIPHFDKVIHAGLFAGFGAFWRLSGMAGRRVLIFGTIAAFASELGQLAPIVNRDFGLDDAIADMVGVLLGYWAASWWVAWPGAEEGESP